MYELQTKYKDKIVCIKGYVSLLIIRKLIEYGNEKQKIPISFGLRLGNMIDFDLVFLKPIV